METTLLFIFISAYLLITFEHRLKINKAAPALLGAVICWGIFSYFNPEHSHEQLAEHTGNVAGILFFLLAAMTIVELIDAHNGFDVITQQIQITDTKKLLWLTAFITFFLSAVLDNLTTALVMTGIIKKLIKDQHTRLLFVGIFIIAANAGGVWSPMGDVTTTMLWIGGQISAKGIISKLFLPGLVALVIPLIFISFKLDKNTELIVRSEENAHTNSRERNIVFWCGLSCLLAVPVLKTTLGLAPYLSIIAGLSLLWFITEILHRNKNEETKQHLGVSGAIQKIDTPSILFFLGILLIIACLESAGILTNMSAWLNDTVGNINIICIIIGLVSAVVDNVPIVAATMGMYDLANYPTDHYLWGFLTYASGTGGSCLIIGSAAGIAAMGMEKITFSWYFKNISLLALLGYLGGAATYILFFN